MQPAVKSRGRLRDMANACTTTPNEHKHILWKPPTVWMAMLWLNKIGAAPGMMPVEHC